MPAVPEWAPAQFDLTNPYNGSMSFNVQTAQGLYLLDQSGCDFRIVVRETTDNVPQSDGSILHHRFLTGVQMDLLITLWEDPDKAACNDSLATMVDDLTGAFRSLLNAGDNEGRLAWAVSGQNQRMLDDVRLLVYPSFKTTGGTNVVTVTIDSQYPYAQDLNQTLTPVSDGSTVVVTNNGTADYFPVFQVNRLNGVTDAGSVTAFTLQNLTTGIDFVWNSALPGASPIAGSNYGEITCFSNTFYLNGNGADLSAGISELVSDYFPLQMGANNIKIVGADTDILWAPAWG